MLRALHDSQAITSTAWMVVLSIIPSDLVRAGAILLGCVIGLCNIAHAIRPKTLMGTLQIRLRYLKERLQIAIDGDFLVQADELFVAQIERGMRRIQYKVSDLHGRTLLISGGVIPEIKAVWRGHSSEIIQCLRDVETLERDIEIHCAMVLKNQYYLWR